ncbi:MAG: hypothetical protein SFU56_03195 [Capsulimonadales bacterium]|nr:hypothetical protein [Capsulimonadales bacterium]
MGLLLLGMHVTGAIFHGLTHELPGRTAPTHSRTDRQDRSVHESPVAASDGTAGVVSPASALSPITEVLSAPHACWVCELEALLAVVAVVTLTAAVTAFLTDSAPFAAFLPCLRTLVRHSASRGPPALA